MSVIQSGLDLGATKLAPEYAKKANSESEISLVQGKTVTQEVVDIDGQDDKQPLTTEQLENVAQQLQNFVGNMNRGLEFSVDKDSGRDVIKVIDKSSGDLVKQFPSEEVLSLVAKLSDMVGGFIDAKV